MDESRLRPITEADLERVRIWRNADPVRRKMYTTHSIGAAEHAAWWQHVRADRSTVLRIFERAGEPLAVVSYTRYTGPGGSATLGFYADPQRTQRRIGAMLEFRAFEHAFDALGVARLEGEVIELNAAVMHFHLRQGGRLEGRRRNAYVRDGIAYDVWCLGLLREDWQDGMRAALLARASGAEDWTGRQLRAELTLPPSDSPEADAAAMAARRLLALLPVPGARLVSQSFEFTAPPAGTVALRARIVTHIGARLVCAVRLQSGGRPFADGYVECRVPVPQAAVTP